MFSRMPNYHITSCEFKEFDAHKFTIENSTEDIAKKETVEGKYYYVNYHLNEGSPEVSDLQVFRNFENALKKINAADNKKLSEARARAVMDVLIAKGIDKERMTATGWGQEKPVADNRTEEGRSKNRRVEIVKKQN
jgi:hypothetical protein